MKISRIDRDLGRFREIVHGRIRENLRRYISHGELIGKQGKNVVSIPVPRIDIPHFRYGKHDQGGVGFGDGEDGEPIDGQQGEGAGQAGEAPGTHILEVEVGLDELARLLGEELELPNIQPKGKDLLEGARDRYRSISVVGPDSLRHFKRSYREALKRQITSGTYDRDNPLIIPTRRDLRFKSWTRAEEPASNAVIIYMMDVSGSMGEEQKEIVRIEAFWIDTWLRSQYKKLETRFVIHDAVAHEVDRDTFFHTRESGGTKISSAYQLCLELVQEHYPPQEWNIYPFHFSDGDNWGGGDTDLCLKLLAQELLPRANLFCYGQVTSTYGSGQFKRDLDETFKSVEHLITSQIDGKDDIPTSIQAFLGKGK